MAGVSLVDNIGVLGSGLGQWEFLDRNFPQQADETSNYRIQVGIFKQPGAYDGLKEPGGEIEMIRVYNGNNNLIGVGGGASGKITDGGFKDFSVEQTNRQQGLITEFYAGNDAVCIAYIGVTFAEGSQWGWVGDWGYICGLDWYASGYMMQHEGGKGPKVSSPYCTWIDKDHTEGLRAAAIGISWPDFFHQSGQTVPDGDGSDKCGAVEGFRAWDKGGGQQIAAPRSARNAARQYPQLPRRSQRSDDRLVISSLGHNATELCESDTSYGPDFVSILEGVYCNMESHEVLPLCANGINMDCFELNGTSGPAVVSRNGKRHLKNPTKIIEWN